MLPLLYSQSAVLFVLTSSLEVLTLVTSLMLSITTFLLTCANISTVLGVLQEQGGQGVPGHWSKNKRWAGQVATIEFHLSFVLGSLLQKHAQRSRPLRAGKTVTYRWKRCRHSCACIWGNFFSAMAITTDTLEDRSRTVERRLCSNRRIGVTWYFYSHLIEKTPDVFYQVFPLHITWTEKLIDI